MKHFAILLLVTVFACSNSGQKNKSESKMVTFEKGTYGYDLKVLQENTKPVELKSGNARILISPEFQGRVMTSTSEGKEGKSYGWINHDLIASGNVL
ncbi:MAG: hypothetical protein HOG79_06030 [Prolixibacteraceae bacterium]|nr:hypothetical protein [Prolixibacteraceae bacterium]